MEMRVFTTPALHNQSHVSAMLEMWKKREGGTGQGVKGCKLWRERVASSKRVTFETNHPLSPSLPHGDLNQHLLLDPLDAMLIEPRATPRGTGGKSELQAEQMGGCVCGRTTEDAQLRAFLRNQPRRGSFVVSRSIIACSRV